MSEERNRAAQAASLSRIGARLLNGARLIVKWLLPPSQDLGFTSEGTPSTVNVAWDNETYMGDMSEEQKSFFRMGVFAHELLHQLFTNFAYSARICDKLTQAEAGIFMNFANTLEDPAIEYFAPNVMGGKLLAALRYTIAVIYKKSPPIDSSSTAFGQMLNALINFGDCGIVKGNFTFPEAKEYFDKIAPLYNEGITCPDSRRRLDIAKECMEITRPLWEEYIKDQEIWDQMVKDLLEFLKKHGMPSVDEDDLEGDEDSAKAGARAITIESIKGDKSGKNGEASDDTDDSEEGADGDSSEGNAESDDTKAEKSGKGKGKKGEEEDEGDESEGSENGDSSDSSSDKDNEGDSSESESDNSDSDSDSETPGGDAPERTMGKDMTGQEILSADEILEEDLILDQDMLDSIMAEIKEEEQKIEKAEREESSKSADVPSFDIDSAYFKHASCINRRVKNASSSAKGEYNALVTSANWEIKTLTKALEKLFSADREETIRATSGSYNIKRGTIGCTARIMDKCKDPANRKVAAVCLCVDLSGSMCSADKIGQARKACIVFAESLRKLGIPYYIMGFRADGAAQAVHEHYVTWDGKGRETLVAMNAGGNNFDGYSIRYASNLLKSRPEANKLLFVISDGEPACSTYKTWEAGIADTYQAVKDARKICNVFGIALGSGCEPEVLQNFYGKDFVHCKDEKLLTVTLGKKLVKQFK